MNLKNVRAFICGGLRSAEQMWEAIYEGWCDGVAMAKPLAAEPGLFETFIQFLNLELFIKFFANIS